MAASRLVLVLAGFLGGAAFGYWGIPSISQPKNADHHLSRAEIAAFPKDTSPAGVPAPKPAAAPEPSLVTPPVNQRQATHPTGVEVIHQIEPEYTETARKAKVTGSVLLALSVTRNGFPQNIRVVRGLGYGLNRKAIDAVAHWRFRPALKDGQPVTAEIQQEVHFR